MSFANNINSNAVPEWKDFYVDYDMLRSKIRRKDFKKALEEELAKINSFYFLLEKKAVEEKNKIFDDVFADLPDENFEDLRAQTEDTECEREALRQEKAPIVRSVGRSADELEENEHEDDGISRDDGFSESSDTMRTRRRQLDHGLKSFMKMPKGITRRKKEKNITEFLHSLVKISAYRDLNASAMLRIAKKHVEIKKTDELYEEFSRKLKSAYFYKSNRVELIRTAIKQLYKRIFAKNQPEKARLVFSRIRKGSKQSDWLFILSGFLVGFGIALGLFHDSSATSRDPLFWAVTNIYIGFIFFGFCLKVFKTFQINYKFIFNLDVCSSMNNSLYLCLVSVLFFAHVASWLAIDLVAVSSRRIYYIASLAIQASVLFLPFDVFFYNSRLYFLSVFAHVIFKPISTVRFRHFYFTDVAQSFSGPLKAILNLGGINDSAVLAGFSAAFPFLRILQCLKRYTASKTAFPHILNCFKFATSIAFAFSKAAEHYNNGYISLSVFLGFVNFLSGLLWDLIMDWHIFRKRYIYPRFVYIFSVFFDILARLLWIVRYYDKNGKYASLEGFAEISRRFLWTLIRVEVEHLNNCNELRAENVVRLTAGELFYKKDHEELYTPSETEQEIGTGFDTEYETEDESGIEQKNEKQHGHQVYPPEDYESCDVSV